MSVNQFLNRKEVGAVEGAPLASNRLNGVHLPSVARRTLQVPLKVEKSFGPNRSSSSGLAYCSLTNS